MFLIALFSSASVRRPSTAKAANSLRPEFEKRVSPAEISSVRSVEIFRKLANRVGGLGDLTTAVAAAGEVFKSGHDFIEPLRILRQRRGHGLDVVQRVAQRCLVLGTRPSMRERTSRAACVTSAPAAAWA